jgi:hypothetical protein
LIGLPQEDSLIVAALALFFAMSLGISSAVFDELYTTACRSGARSPIRAHNAVAHM